jgi:polar amino acid transport system permease protein
MLLPGDRHTRRFGIVDAVLIPLLIGVIIYVYIRMRTGLRYHWDWSFLPQYFFRTDIDTGRIMSGSLTRGILTTLRLSIWSSILALIIGTIAGVARTSRNRVARLFGRIYVEIVRNIPPLVIVFIFYFFFGNQITQWLGIEAAVARAGPGALRALSIFFSDPKRLPEFISAVITLGIYEGSYVTEIVRAGIESVPKGQWEAAHAVGLSRFQQYRFVALPLALRSILPSLAGQFISAIKDSAIVSVISIQEITFQGLELMASTYRTFEVWITITLLYFLLTAACSLGARRIERSLHRSRR